MSRPRTSRRVFLQAASAAVAVPYVLRSAQSWAADPPRGPIKFVAHRIGNFRSAACCVADFNNDGKLDIAAGNYLYLAPDWKPRQIREVAGSVDQKGKGYHDDFMNLPLDVNGDGLNDIITGSAHGYGLFWYQQIRQGDQIRWKQHVIDDTWTQVHATALADLDGDGVPDIVTGKRFMAHNGSDPDEYGPLGLYWYKLERGPQPKWTKYAISYNEGIGAGLNICVADLDGDGDLDIVVTGKFGGQVWFESKRK